MDTNKEVFERLIAERELKLEELKEEIASLKHVLEHKNSTLDQTLMTHSPLTFHYFPICNLVDTKRHKWFKCLIKHNKRIKRIKDT